MAGTVGKCQAGLLSQPHQNNSQTTEKPLLRTAWSLPRQKSCNEGYEGEAISRLVRGVRVWSKLLSHPRVAVQPERNILAVEVPPQKRGVPAPHQALQPRVPVLRRQVLTPSGYEYQCRLRETEAAGPRSSSKRAVHGLTRTHLLWALSAQKASRDTWRGTELSGSTTRAEILAEPTVPLQSPPPAGTLPHDSLRPHPTQQSGPRKLLQVSFQIQMAYLGSRWGLSWNRSNVHKHQRSSIWPPCTLYLKPGTSGSQAQFTALHLSGASKPCTSGSNLQITW